MGKALTFNKGEIVLGYDKIIIIDNAEKEKFWRIVSGSIWTAYGIISAISYVQTSDEFLLWSGIIIGAINFTTIIYDLLSSTKKEINLQEIVRAAFKERFGNIFLDLKLKNGLKRRVGKIELVSDELRAFFFEKGVVVE